jgi:hypothetical protein
VKGNDISFKPEGALEADYSFEAKARLMILRIKSVPQIKPNTSPLRRSDG